MPNTRDASLENIEGNARLSGDFSPVPKCFSIYLKTKFWITGVTLRTDHIDQKWTNRDSMRSEKRSLSSALLFSLFINLRVNSRQAVVLCVLKLAHDAFND